VLSAAVVRLEAVQTQLTESKSGDAQLLLAVGNAEIILKNLAGVDSEMQCALDSRDRVEQDLSTIVTYLMRLNTSTPLSKADEWQAHYDRLSTQSKLQQEQRNKQEQREKECATQERRRRRMEYEEDCYERKKVWEVPPPPRQPR